MSYSASFPALFFYFNVLSNFKSFMQDCSYKLVIQFGLVTFPYICFYLFNRLRYLKKINDWPGLCTSKATFDKRVSCEKLGEKAPANFGLPVASGLVRSRLLPLTASDTIKKPNGTNLHFARARSCLSKLNTSLRSLAEMNST
jgi:hypothetical protein